MLSIFLVLFGLLWSQCSLAIPLPASGDLTSVLSSTSELVNRSPVASPVALFSFPVATSHSIHRRNDTTASTTIEKAFRLTTVQPSESLPPIPEAPSASSSAESPQYVVATDDASSSSSDHSGKDNEPSSPSSGSDKCGPHEAAIVISNNADHDICYMVELSTQSNRVKEITAPCGPGNGFTVPAGKGGREFCPGSKFVGALTAFHKGVKGKSSARSSHRRDSMSNAEKGRGSRFEFNFQDSATWYDVDYEMGIDSSTLAPSSDKNAKVGEKDVVAKVDKAYQALSDSEKAEIKSSGYVDVDNSGKVEDVRMDKKAPDSIVNFLQLKAELTGYVNAGSVQGENEERKARFGAKGVAMADRQSKRTEEKRLLITSY